MQYLDALSKTDRMISVHFQGKPFNITIIQVYALTNNAEEAEVEQFYEDLQDLLELTLQKRCPFHYRGLECKSRKSRNTWSNRQIWPEIQNEAGQRLIEFCQENALVIANTLFQQHKRRLYTWTSPDDQYGTRLITFFAAKDGEALYSQQKTRPGADCGSDHELLIAKFRHKLKKVGKTTRSFRYDLNQIPYDYTVEVRNRF